MGFTVRDGSFDEYEAVGVTAVAAYRADGQLEGEGDAGYEVVLADVATRAAQAELIVAVDDDTADVLGAVMFCPMGTPYAQLARAGEAEFRMLAVFPAAQGRGVGTALVQECLRRAEALGCTGVVICTRSFAAPAKRLYARLGFVRDPERDFSPGPGVDLHALRIALPASDLALH